MEWCITNPYPDDVEKNAMACDICTSNITIEEGFHHCQECASDFCKECGQSKMKKDDENGSDISLKEGEY